MQNKTAPLFVSSDTALGAFNVTSGIDRFDVQFKNTLDIPLTAKNITLQLTQATVPWTVLNISVEKANNLFRLKVDGNPGTPFDVTIPDGLYGVNDLSDAINRELINEGLVGGLVVLTGDNSTGRVLITLTEADLQVEWIVGSMFELTGFNSGQEVPAAGFTAAAFSELGPNVANFSDVSSFLAHTTLLGASGIPIGNKEAQVMAQIQITVPPGSQINFQPQNPIKMAVPHLIGQKINEASFYMTDQLNRGVDFNQENFTFLVELKWLEE